ncbi:MAG TPA: ABC transporter permease [Acidobacteriaceae bacterium]|jgi:predicted permease
MTIFRRIANLFSRSRVDREIEAEIQSHIELRTEDNVTAGMSPAEARREALLRFGSPTAMRERTASVDVALNLEGIWSDLLYAARQLRRSPGFTITAVLTLALAIGANAVVFSIMNAFLLRPLNVPHAESLYGIWRTSTNDMAQSYPDYLDFRDRNRSFESLAAYSVTAAGLDTGQEPSRVWIEEASGNYFDALELQPYLGRMFHSADEHGADSAPFIVLTYAYWHSHFQDDRGVIGRVVRLNSHPFTILGVAQPGFAGTIAFFHPDLFIPIVNHPMFGYDDLYARGDRSIFMTLGHLKPGVTPAQAAADLNSIGAYLETTYPKDDPGMKFVLARPGLYGDYVSRPLWAFMSGLMLLSGLILLAACANLGGLFAARAADRAREVALRLALGSSRKRILRGLFTEAFLLSLLGGTVGLAGSVALLHGLSAWQPVARWPVQMSVNPDVNVYLVALLLALVSGALFGVVPVAQVLRTNPYEVVKGSTAVAKRGRFGLRLTVRDVLLVVQIALCAVLVTSSIVAVRGLGHSLHNNFGFAVQNTLLAEADVAMAGYRGDKVPPLQKRMIETVKAIPGVESVGLADQVPLGDAQPDSPVFHDNTADLKPSSAAGDVLMFKVSPEYFHAAGTALLSGRVFTWQDEKDKVLVAVVNREFSHRIFGSESAAMGGYFKMPDGKRIQVVGIAEDGKYGSLTEDPKPAMFLPILQWPSAPAYLVVRSSSDPVLLGSAIRSRLHELDAGLPIYIQTRFQSLDSTLLGPRMATLALGVLGVIGAMLSITGIFGMAAYSVSKRLRELGIRIALGAKRTELLQAALGRALKLLAIGSIGGLVLGVLASRVLASIVSQASARDPLVLSGVILVMASLGLVATWIPAQRALAVDPVRLLREE